MDQIQVRHILAQIDFLLPEKDHERLNFAKTLRKEEEEKLVSAPLVQGNGKLTRTAHVGGDHRSNSGHPRQPAAYPCDH